MIEFSLALAFSESRMLVAGAALDADTEKPSAAASAAPINSCFIMVFALHQISAIREMAGVHSAGSANEWCVNTLWQIGIDRDGKRR